MNTSLDVRPGKHVAKITSILKSPWALFCLSLLASVYLKLSALGSRELSLDETYSAFVVKMPFAEFLKVIAGDVHPPLFYSLLWGWVRIAGDAQMHLMLLSVVLSICASFAMFALGARMLGNRFGAFAAALFSLSPALFVYSLEVRGYMLLILVLVCLLIVHWAVVVEQREARWLIAAYSLLAALLFWVHYLGAFILLGLLVHWVMTSAPARGRMIRLCAAGALTFLFISPMIPLLPGQYAEKLSLEQAIKLGQQNPDSLNFGGSERSTLHWLNDLKGNFFIIAGYTKAGYVYLYKHFSGWSLLLLLSGAALAIALTGAGLLWIVKGDQVCRLFGVITSAAAVGMVAIHFLTKVSSMGGDRYMLCIVPVLVIAIARAVQYGTEKPRWRIPSLAVGVVILIVYAAGSYRQAIIQYGHPWQAVVNDIQHNYRPGDKVIFNATYAQVPFDYFAGQLQFRPEECGFPISIYDWWGKQKAKGWGGPIITHSDLDRFVSGLSTTRSRTLWLVLYDSSVYDSHDALLARMLQLGQVTEFQIPQPTPETLQSDSVRLIRISEL